MARPANSTNTSERILDVAERLVQTRGFNAFSYADIADALDITKASLHYHFSSKAELGKRLIERYEKNFLKALGQIDGSNADAVESCVVISTSMLAFCAPIACAFAEFSRRNSRHYPISCKPISSVFSKQMNGGLLRCLIKAAKQACFGLRRLRLRWRSSSWRR